MLRSNGGVQACTVTKGAVAEGDLMHTLTPGANLHIVGTTASMARVHGAKCVMRSISKE